MQNILHIMRHFSETFLSLNTLQDTSTYHAALRLNQVEPITQDYVNELIIQQKKRDL